MARLLVYIFALIIAVRSLLVTNEEMGERMDNEKFWQFLRINHLSPPSVGQTEAKETVSGPQEKMDDFFWYRCCHLSVI